MSDIKKIINPLEDLRTLNPLIPMSATTLVSLFVSVRVNIFGTYVQCVSLSLQLCMLVVFLL